MRVLLFFLCPAMLIGDSLILKSGQNVTGAYAGGDPRSIRFLVGDQIQTFAIGNVVRVIFGDGDSAGGWRVLSAGGSSDRAAANPPLSAGSDEKQRRFCQLIQDYRDANMRYTNEPNPIKRADMRKPEPYDWEPSIVGLFGNSGRFDNWTGTVRFRVDGQHVAASFFPDCKGFPQAIEFATASRYVFGSGDSQTMIPLHSPIAETLGQISGNHTVLASGHLFYLAHGNPGSVSMGQRAELRQRYKSAPNSPSASVASPRYLATFESISLQR